MSDDDFMNNWNIVQMCHLNLESFSEEHFKQDDVHLCLNFNVSTNLGTLL